GSRRGAQRGGDRRRASEYRGGSSPTGGLRRTDLVLGGPDVLGKRPARARQAPSHDEDRGVIVGRRSWLPLRQRRWAWAARRGGPQKIAHEGGLHLPRLPQPPP